MRTSTWTASRGAGFGGTSTTGELGQSNAASRRERCGESRRPTAIRPPWHGDRPDEGPDRRGPPRSPAAASRRTPGRGTRFAGDAEARSVNAVAATTRPATTGRTRVRAAIRSIIAIDRRRPPSSTRAGGRLSDGRTRDDATEGNGRGPSGRRRMRTTSVSASRRFGRAGVRRSASSLRRVRSPSRCLDRRRCTSCTARSGPPSSAGRTWPWSRAAPRSSRADGRGRSRRRSD